MKPFVTATTAWLFCSVWVSPGCGTSPPKTSNSSVSPYSISMASSIISRGQGVMTGQGGSSELLQAGITQKAFRRLIEQYPHHPSTPIAASYIKTSANSVVNYLANSTRDSSYPLDRLSNGNALIGLYEESGNETYRHTFEALRESINIQKRNAAGGYWYYVYPEWSYLDGMYSLAPFYALYTKLYNSDNTSVAVADVLYQLDLLWKHCHDNSTGLLVHGYDYSRTAVWSDPITGASPHVWGRSLGWYMMALVDTLDLLPLSHQSSEWRGLKLKLETLSHAVARAADPASGAWWQVLDEPGRKGNYIESSGSAMFVYSLLRGTALGYFHGYEELAVRAYESISNDFVVKNNNGTISYNGTVAVCSLNSTASYDYYISQPILYDSVLGSASFVLASLEVENYLAGSCI